LINKKKKPHVFIKKKKKKERKKERSVALENDKFIFIFFKEGIYKVVIETKIIVLINLRY
jgi:hypothetical protein